MEGLAVGVWFELMRLAAHLFSEATETRQTIRGLFWGALICFVLFFGCSKRNIAKPENTRAEDALNGKYLDTSRHSCWQCTNFCNVFYVIETQLNIDAGQFRLSILHQSSKPEVISGTVLRNRDTVTLVLDSSSVWGEIPSIESKYLLKDSNLKPILNWVDGQLTNNLIPGCVIDGSHQFVRVK